MINTLTYPELKAKMIKDGYNEGKHEGIWKDNPNYKGGQVCPTCNSWVEKDKKEMFSLIYWTRGDENTVITETKI